ncbi:organic hydroperoxide resistance protein [Paracoccus sediminis]|jgi:osmotically inducible protein OsmC|uniref:Organic hydroperoxide resistance protein n=1 Tax=Paracoccus sediminis TaxID=1214787 RepID=A0A238YHG7_9RHOB|nr:organic hydroperoxide resistance protein [Paracoccus sediminis]TBN46645.1 organic hydroperoxide resistance protein [Paracoccus sediminis]SNR70161.1 peroxiredoxin, Ohr subfamily [Paracoccus sediminis]
MGVIYKTSATASHEGRNGKARSDDGLLDLSLAFPRELGGAGGATNPEQLFAAGYAACFTSAIQLVARENKMSLGSPEVTCNAGLESAPDGKFRLFAGLDVSLPGASRDDAETALREAHAICPYSRAVRGNVDVTLRLTRWKDHDGSDAPLELSQS